MDKPCLTYETCTAQGEVTCPEAPRQQVAEVGLELRRCLVDLSLPLSAQPAFLSLGE